MMKARQLSILATMLVLTGAGHVRAENGDGTGGGTGGGNTVRLDSRVQLWVSGDARGPNKIGKNTGAGIMDANFTFDQTAAAKANAGTEVLLGTTYTRSANQPNGDNSYMQGGFSLAKLTAQGITIGQTVDLPVLEGERAYMRPLIAFTPKYVVLIAASEDNDSNNGNPKPVMFLADKTTGQLVKIANNKRALQKPIDLISVALANGIQVDNPNNQRGPHMIVPVTDDSFLVGMQYNNQAQEVFRVTVNADATVRMNWLQRYSNNAVHNRPQVAYTPGATEAYMTAVECNAQPANIGVRLTKLDVGTGKPIASKIVVRAVPNQNKYVAEPHIADVGDKVALVYGLSAKARNRDGGNGHAGGANVSQVALFDKTDLAMVGEPLAAPANYQRHPGAFAMKYGSEGLPAIGVISGSSTGTSKGLLQVIPVKTDGTLGGKDPLKMYTVSTYSDVANLQARGKRNPNNQAKGFINGIGDVPNPGFDKPGGFYPEVKTFSFSTVTGYSGTDAAAKGLKESLWLSLVPATWKPGLQTTPGGASENAGNGPAPRTNGPATNENGESGDEGNALAGTEATTPTNANARVALGLDNGGDGCAVATTPGRGDVMTFAVAALAVGALIRRRRDAKKEAS